MNIGGRVQFTDAGGSLVYQRIQSFVTNIETNLNQRKYDALIGRVREVNTPKQLAALISDQSTFKSDFVKSVIVEIKSLYDEHMHAGYQLLAEAAMNLLLTADKKAYEGFGVEGLMKVFILMSCERAYGNDKLAYEPYEHAVALIEGRNYDAGQDSVSEVGSALGSMAPSHVRGSQVGRQDKRPYEASVVSAGSSMFGGGGGGSIASSRAQNPDMKRLKTKNS
jgi:hypothetical protein